VQCLNVACKAPERTVRKYGGQDGHDKSHGDHDKIHGLHEPNHGLHVLSYARHDFWHGFTRFAPVHKFTVKGEKSSLQFGS
jgi:hypothetical protein